MYKSTLAIFKCLGFGCSLSWPVTICRKNSSNLDRLFPSTNAPSDHVILNMKRLVNHDDICGKKKKKIKVFEASETEEIVRLKKITEN